ncbi:surface-adhesin E family protein [Chromobacterium haemolyticum]|uniref:surface-adhesin E family protein n=1 Tax=Chromobacterium haemolyticum TaxID=394935 RepID=UPI0009DA4B6F|nr:surface-adhesin E family protein [Chromobacterium haemolyticum]OQS41814.1 hypothetical protein B0T39_07705 [Chromobacterium haemolyticum]
MRKIIALSLLALSTTTLASSWDLTYFSPKTGTLFIDKDSITDGPGGSVKFWTLFAPRFEIGKPGEDYAYNQSMHLINCKERTAALKKSTYFDENRIPHDAKVADDKPQDITPDSENDFLWTYICKPESRKEVATSLKGGINEFIQSQLKYARENKAYRQNRN